MIVPSSLSGYCVWAELWIYNRIVAVISINTTDSKKIEVGLQIKEKEDRVVEEIENRSSQRVLLLIDFLLRQNKLSISEIDEIRVSSGPGSFTGIKVGVSIANALGFALGVPVNGREQAKPKYE
ncbi:MAG: hypothetical protein UU21_C0010G0014 [Candidatus Levybacteria bacterium GW2011_GWA2_40_8]|nr:MAG: hypothetical protein UU21_C0010G0014 [Candidatus Levybacteria bacterium GW2011_GWA2_40_8]